MFADHVLSWLAEVHARDDAKKEYRSLGISAEGIVNLSSSCEVWGSVLKVEMD
jgi:hypothetical protein